MRVFSEADFGDLSFHDNLLRGVLLRSDEAGISDLILDIDHITEWVAADGGYAWLIAAADLIFHGVTGLKFSIDWHDEKYQVVSGGDWILDVSHEPVVPQLVYLDRPYWRWDFSFAMETQLSFGAYGFTLRHRQEPIRHNEQSLPLALRA
ncbi:MAG: hypothetical protein L0228_13285 [Planctomycetes bacterium]|nr:hypothetical protein [Planctomycetota bacterium]